jgi:hypothetical protein
MSVQAARLKRIAARRAVTLGHMTGARYQQGSYKLNRHKMYGVFGKDSLLNRHISLRRSFF